MKEIFDMKHIFSKLAVIVLATSAVAAHADTATASFNVKMTILKACSVSTVAPTDLNFGSQNTTATGIVESTAGVISVSCSKKTPYTIGLLPSAANGGTSAGTGSMKSATTTDLVPYSLYSDAARTTVWGNLSTNWVSGTRLASDPLTKTYNVYGKVPNADFTPGTDYIDPVLVTLTY